jgi:hypothetical protein
MEKKNTTLASLGKGLELYLTLAAGDTYEWAPCSPLTFNKIKQDNCNMKCGCKVMSFRDGDSAVKTKVCGRYIVDFQCNAPAASTNAFNITDNEGNNDYTDGSVDSTAFAALYINEDRGTISIVNVGTAAIVLTGNSTNSLLPVAKLRVTYEGA